jgi:hypothetical protein
MKGVPLIFKSAHRHPRPSTDVLPDLRWTDYPQHENNYGQTQALHQE